MAKTRNTPAARLAAVRDQLRAAETDLAVLPMHEDGAHAARAAVEEKLDELRNEVRDLETEVRNAELAATELANYERAHALQEPTIPASGEE